MEKEDRDRQASVWRQGFPFVRCSATGHRPARGKPVTDRFETQAPALTLRHLTKCADLGRAWQARFVHRGAGFCRLCTVL
jgi:hypothetical protein